MGAQARRLSSYCKFSIDSCELQASWDILWSFLQSWLHVARCQWPVQQMHRIARLQTTSNMQCGTGASKLCCKTREKCVGPVKPKTGADMYVCSEARQLSGSKAVKIVILPMFGLIMDIAIVALMAAKLNIRRNHVTKACVAVVVVSWPLFLSSMWAKGF